MLHADGANVYYDANTTLNVYLWRNSLKDFIRDYQYQAALASLHVDVSRTWNGIKIIIKGYNDSLEGCLNWLLGEMESFNKFDNEDRFNNISSDLKKKLEGAIKSDPYQVSLDWLDECMSERHFSTQNLITHLDNINYKDFMSFKKTWMSNLRITA